MPSPKTSPCSSSAEFSSVAFQQLTGMNSILFYAPAIFHSLGFGSGASLYSSTITSAALVVAALISMSLVDKFGRRAFFLEASVEMILCLVAVSITLALKFGEGKELPKGIGVFLVIAIRIFVLAYGRLLGTTRMASSERAFSIGDEIGGTERSGLREYDFHSSDCTVFSGFSLPS